MIIRPAIPEDMPEIISMCEAFSRFYGTKKPLWNKDYTPSVLEALVRDHIVLVGVDEEPGSVMGFVAGFLGPHPFNREITILTEAAWWVIPKYRRGQAGRLLMDAFISKGRGDVDWVICTLEEDSPVRDEFFLQRGFANKERSFILES